jgi:hypothetical protein
VRGTGTPQPPSPNVPLDLIIGRVRPFATQPRPLHLLAELIHVQRSPEPPRHF